MDRVVPEQRLESVARAEIRTTSCCVFFLVVTTVSHIWAAVRLSSKVLRIINHSFHDYVYDWRAKLAPASLQTQSAAGNIRCDQLAAATGIFLARHFAPHKVPLI